MAYNVSRLTIYAIIASIEDDLRSLIFEMLDVEGNTAGILGDEVYPKARKRLEVDLDIASEELAPHTILNYLDFSDAYHILNSNSSELPAPIANYVKQITPALEALAPIRNRVAHTRPLNYDDLAKTLDTAQEFARSNVAIWNELRATLIKLKDTPSFVLGLEIPSNYLYAVDQSHNLPTPDFDDTGFIGREKQAKELIKLLEGPYPVITIIGEGGVGKTALALKAAYDILDSPKSPFETIVWTTSKTMQITPHEIRRIEGAIYDSLGMLNSIAKNLAGDQYVEPMDEILMYLGEFRILLILDNLETVLDARIRDFLERLPSGSKILITSRLGLGAFEFPVKLSPMDEMESVILLRALAEARGVERLTRVSNKTLAKFCRKMKNNPGYLKWFVSAVQTGKRPEEVLQNPDLFLEFCMSNVYEFLSEVSRQVLETMICAPGEHSQAELAFLTEVKDISVLQQSLQELLTTNMVIMSSIPTGSSYTSRYDLADLPREYLLKYHAPEQEIYSQIQKRKRQLIADEERALADQATKPYSPYTILVRSQSDLIVARFLQTALKHARNNDFTMADAEIDKARTLAPEYFEVYRVSAWVRVMQKNLMAARTAYEVAVELEATHAPLLYWYAEFLLIFLDDSTGALNWYSNAEKLDGNSIDVKFGKARANLYLQNFDEAEMILLACLERNDLSDTQRRKTIDMYLQVYHRRAEYFSSHQDCAESINALEKLKEIYLSAPSRLVDTEMRSKVQKAYRTAEVCMRISKSEEQYYAASTIAEWIYSIGLKSPSNIPTGERHHGEIIRLPMNRPFGFIKLENGDEIYFHKNDMYDSQEWKLISIGTKVRFAVGSNDRGACAVGVVLDRKD